MAQIKGGGKLEGYLKDLAKRLKSGASVKVGFLENATYEDGKPVAMIAAIQEFGAPAVGIPLRPYFRTMVQKESPTWGKGIATQLEENDFNAKKALGITGEVIKGQLQQSIIDTNAPALSPVTLMLRKMKANDPNLKVNGTVVADARARVQRGDDYSGVSTKPLVETGHLLASVDYEVK